MKSGWVLAVILGVACGCNNGGSGSETVDSLGKSIDSRFNRIADSTEKNLKNLKEKIERKVENIDSSRRN